LVILGDALLAIPVSGTGGTNVTKPASPANHPVTVAQPKAPAASPAKHPTAPAHVATTHVAVTQPKPPAPPPVNEQSVEQKVRGNVNTLIGQSPMHLTLKDLEVNDYLADGHKEGDKIALITLHVGNVDWSGTETREDLLKEAVPLFHRLYQIPQIAEVDVSFDVPGVDAYGNNSDIEGAMQISLKRETAKKMNFDYMEVYYDEFGKMAGIYTVAPALQQN
jgi:hypothetical protein